MQRAILQYAADGGPLLIPIIMVAVAIWAYLLRLRRALEVALRLAWDVEKSLDAWMRGEASRGETLAKLEATPGCIARHALSAYREGTDRDAARLHFERLNTRLLTALLNDLFILKALSAAAPLLGLLGTVSGMVTTFDTVARLGSDGADGVAGGISAALITTQFGLVAALPGVFGLAHLGRLFHRLTQRIDAISMRVDTTNLLKIDAKVGNHRAIDSIPKGSLIAASTTPC